MENRENGILEEVRKWLKGNYSGKDAVLNSFDRFLNLVGDEFKDTKIDKREKRTDGISKMRKAIRNIKLQLTMSDDSEWEDLRNYISIDIARIQDVLDDGLFENHVGRSLQKEFLNIFKEFKKDKNEESALKKILNFESKVDHVLG